MGSNPLSSALYGHIYSDLSGQVSPGLIPYIFGGDTDRNGEPLETPRNATEFAAQALAKSILKKFEDEIVEGVPEKVALDKFLAANQKCADWNKPGLSFIGPLAEGTLEPSMLYGEFRSTVYDVFNGARDVGQRWYEDPNVSWLSWLPVFDQHSVLDWTRISFYATNGPGMVQGARDCSFLDKFDQSSLTASRQFLIELFQSRVARSPNWTQAEKTRFGNFGYSLSEATKLTFVPKTISEARCICIEPALNMFFQKGVEFLLCEVLKQVFNIDLTVQQSVNAELARVGSINGSYATIDLSSASDTIALSMCKDVLPKDVFSHLSVLRSPMVLLPDGELVTLNMISTMGNAFTFPLQTILFACAVSTVYRLLGIPLMDGRIASAKLLPFADQCQFRNFAVNGDDIIIDTRAVPLLYQLLKLLGFSVNAGKSFCEGPFRESCGSDWYTGQGVRGVYCKTLKTQQDCYSLINRLVRWSADHGITLRSTCSFLVNRTRRLLVPPDIGDDAGIHTPLIAAQEKSATRRVIPRGCGSFQALNTYQFYQFIPNGLSFEEVDRIFTPSGVMVAVAKGECAGGRLVRRSDRGNYRLVESATPRWDRAKVRGGGFSAVEASWMDAFRLNLGQPLGLL